MATYCKPLSLILLFFCGASAAAEVAPTVPVFQEVAEVAGIDHRYAGPWEFFVGGGAASFDCNGDRLPEVFIAGGESPIGFFINRSKPGGPLRFEAADLFRGLANPTSVTGAYPINLDNDGYTDLVVLRVGENMLLKGGPDCTFTTANESFGFDGGSAWTTGFAASWERGATFPTLAFGNYVDREAEGTPFGTCEDNLLVRPEPGPAPIFTAVTALKPSHCTLSLLFTDWAGSGQFDLRVANDRQYYRGGQEQLWRVAPGEAPREYGPADGWRELVIWGMGIAEADLDRDGRPEYAISSMGDTKLQVQEGNEPSYRDIAFDRGATAHRPYQGDNSKPSTGWHTQFADVNNDGHLDLFIAKGNVEAMPEAAAVDPDNLLLGTKDGRFVESGGAAGIALARRGRGAVLEDFNADGQLDLLVVNRAEPVSLFQNTGSAGGNFLALKLNGSAINADAIGAVIEVTVGGQSQRKTIQIGGGHASGQIGFAHFGLGAAEAATLRVTWPDGKTSSTYDVNANTFAVLSRGAAALEEWVP